MTTWTRVEPQIEPDEQGDWWEPWTPRVGDRVRVRLSGECWYCGRAEIVPLNGFVGRVAHVDGHEDFRWYRAADVSEDAIRHRFWVDLENGDQEDFAACELELLERAETGEQVA